MIDMSMRNYCIDEMCIVIFPFEKLIDVAVEVYGHASPY